MSKKEQPKKKGRFMAFLTSLCSSKSASNNDNIDKKKCKMKMTKTPRLTFHLDRVLVKVSRKNIAEEQFMQNEVLTFHLEKYLANRLKDCSIVVFSGQFSNFLTEKIPYSIQIKSTRQEAFEKENNYILSNPKGQIRFKLNSIDTMVFQLYFGDKENQENLLQNSDKMDQKMKELSMASDLDRIQQILRFYYKKVDHFIFVCHKDLKYQDMHNLFLVFKQCYLFEFQRVKKIQKTVCNIIYVSSQTKFLKIDDLSLCDFILTEFDRMNSFDEGSRKKHTQSTLKSSKQKQEITKIDQVQQKQDKNKERNSLSQQKSKRQMFQCLIRSLLNRNLHLEVSQALGSILDFPEKKLNKVKWFLELMHERYSESRQIIEQYRTGMEQQKQEDYSKMISQCTPIFANRLKESNNFSKVTALFQTHGDNDEDDFILYNNEDCLQMEF